VNGPVAPGLAFRAAVDSVDRDGYLSNAQNDDHDRQLRLKGLYQADRFSIMAAVYYEQYANGYGQGTVLPFIDNPPAPTKYMALAPATYNAPNNLWEAYGRLEADLGFATATLIPSYTKQVNPSTTSPILMFTQFNTAPAINSAYDELRLASKPGSKLTWVVGGNYYKVISITTSTFTFGPVLLLSQASAISTKSWGFFGEATYPITDTLRATAGLRYTKEEQADHETGLQPDPVTGDLTPYDNSATPVFKSTNWKARLEYDVRPENLLYASVSTGFLPGGIASTGIIPFAAQTVTAYEIGSKNRFLADRLQLNGSVFFYDYPNLQGAAIEFVGTVPVTTITLNNPATYKGGELEGLFQLTKDDKVSLSVAYLDAHYTSLTPLALSFFGGTQLASAPRWEVSGVVDHRFRLPGGATLTPEARAVYKSDTYVSQSVEPFALQSGYTLVDLSLIYASADGKYGVTGYVRNLTDVYYKTAGILESGQSLDSQGLFVGIPRTYGVVLSAHF
jgi:iron complex outermembrane receptor protein